MSLISLRPPRRYRRLLPIALVLLIAAGALGALDPWSNDWVFLSVRGVAQRGGAMPLPTASRTYESADVGALAGPYVQTLEEITLAPGAMVADVGSDGAAVLLGLDGRVQVLPAGGSSVQIGPRQATLLQPGIAVQVTNAGDRPASINRSRLIISTEQWGDIIGVPVRERERLTSPTHHHIAVERGRGRAG